MAILGEWTRTTDYTIRSNNINDGTGSNAPIALNGTTVFDDGDIDDLFGSGGRDWFFADLDGLNGDDDILRDKKPYEKVDLL